MDKSKQKIEELEKRIMAIENILNIRERFKKETGRDVDMCVLEVEDPLILSPWKES